MRLFGNRSLVFALLFFLGQQSFGYCPRAKRSRSATRAGLAGYLFETAHNAIAPIWQPGAYIRSRELGSVVEGAHSDYAHEAKGWLEHEIRHAAETREHNRSSGIARPDARMTLRVAERLQPKPPGSAMLKTSTAGLGRAVMKNLFLASVTLAAVIAGPATAADLPFEAPPPLPAAYYDWSGAYVGFNVGGTHYNVTHHFPSPGAITPDVTTGDHDAVFGIHAGAQWQWSTWVLGAEVARSGCARECRSTSSVLPVSQGFEENIFGEHKIIDLLTAGARVGYAWDRLLVFAAGGFASAHIENAHCSTITGICDAPGPGNGVVSNNRG